MFGGSGFVGSRVVEQLKKAGCEVVSVSRSGEVKADLSTYSPISVGTASEELKAALAGASCAVSCVGTIGGSDAEMRKGNGTLNENAAKAAKEAGVTRFVYVSVADVVRRTVTALPGGLLGGYFEGKKAAEAAVEEGFAEPVIVCPSFIYGGEEFELTPPRVPAGYGSSIEKLLGSAPIKSISQAVGSVPAIGGVVKLTLAPPVNVDSVAKATAAAALGQVTQTRIDGTAAINSAAEAFSP